MVKHFSMADYEVIISVWVNFDKCNNRISMPNKNYCQIFICLIKPFHLFLFLSSAIKCTPEIVPSFLLQPV